MTNTGTLCLLCLRAFWYILSRSAYYEGDRSVINHFIIFTVGSSQLFLGVRKNFWRFFSTLDTLWEWKNSFILLEHNVNSILFQALVLWQKLHLKLYLLDLYKWDIDNRLPEHNQMFISAKYLSFHILPKDDLH